MKSRSIFNRWQNYGCLAVALLAGGLSAAAQGAAPLSTPLSGNVSLRHEVQHAIEKCCAWLAAKQNTNG